MRYRRVRTNGGTYFFTLVTHNRRKFLCTLENVALLRSVLKTVMVRHPFTIDAMVIMPDHIHALWTLPEGDHDYAIRWSLVKSGFTRNCNEKCKGVLSASRIARKQQAVWQHRFWEHKIRDEADFECHADYIHYNPVKHGIAKTPADWKYSSFHRYVKEGIYPLDWGSSEEMKFPGTIGKE
jgi:putative transposase